LLLEISTPGQDSTGGGVNLLLEISTPGQDSTGVKKIHFVVK
jgi:ribosome maturation factor RimP